MIHVETIEQANLLVELQQERKHAILVRCWPIVFNFSVCIIFIWNIFALTRFALDRFDVVREATQSYVHQLRPSCFHIDCVSHFQTLKHCHQLLLFCRILQPIAVFLSISAHQLLEPLEDILHGFTDFPVEFGADFQPFVLVDQFLDHVAFGADFYFGLIAIGA